MTTQAETVAAQPLDLRPLDLSPRGIAEICELLRAVWPEAKQISEAYVDWQYNQNPEGQAFGFNAYDTNKLVGHYVTLPVRARISGEEVPGLLSLNTAVHENYRGRNLFKLLAAGTYDAGAKADKRFVIGVSNQNSTLLFKRQLKFQVVCPLDVKLGLGSIRHKPRTEPPVFERVWTEQLIQWRLNRPDRPYRRASTSENQAKVLGPTGVYGIWAQIAALDSAQVSALSAAGILLNPLRLWIGLDQACDWSRSLYFDVPMKFRPSPLNFIFKDLSGGGRTLEREQIKFSLLDFDAY